MVKMLLNTTYSGGFNKLYLEVSRLANMPWQRLDGEDV